MLVVFIFVLIGTFVVVRTLSHALHDYTNGRGKTITQKMRDKTGLDFHHIHFSAPFLLFAILVLWFAGFDFWFYAFLAISISLVLDQIPCYTLGLDYFEERSMLVALVFHFMVVVIAVYISLLA